IPVGPWANWFLGLAELVHRYPQADAYLIIPDDAVFCRNLRAFLERSLWPAERVGVVLLSCPTSSAPPISGWQRIDHWWQTQGTLAYLFPGAGARLLLSHPRLIGPGCHASNEVTVISTLIWQWAVQTGLPVYSYWPSLAQSIGTASMDEWAGRCRKADFVGEDFDALSLQPANITASRTGVISRDGDEIVVTEGRARL
ncbi:MAG TPA: hypothetical protein VH575_35135, partial [Gemmataceae bacterium]